MGQQRCGEAQFENAAALPNAITLAKLLSLQDGTGPGIAYTAPEPRPPHCQASTPFDGVTDDQTLHHCAAPEGAPAAR